MEALDAVVLTAVVGGAGCAFLRWLRVAQREHYLVGEVMRFSWRWWRGSPDNAVVGAVGLVGAGVSVILPPLALLTAAAAAFGPLRLGLRGRTSRLAWTRRLSTLAGVTTVLEAVGVGAGAVGGGLTGAIVAAAVTCVLAPLVVDLALLVTRPAEDIAAGRFVKRATVRLKKVAPLVVGITGSYGKTTTKGYVEHLLSPHRTTLASPRSFNNRAGLARTVNEHLGPATEVLVAEMGTYGPGEIAEMCSWLRPQVSVITAIGPAHLERFRSLDKTLAAKAEIAETARVVVLNGDDERLARLAGVLRRGGKTVVEASGTNAAADVAVLASPDGLELRVAGRRVGSAFVPSADRPVALSNVACAVAVALESGVTPEDAVARLSSLPVPPNRLHRYIAREGYVIFDDTFNSNPTGARIGIARLRDETEVAEGGSRVVVTPGMVELGERQFEENADLGEEAARGADRLVIVGRTNRGSLEAGAARVDGTEVMRVDRLDEALEWVRSNLGPGDAVLYENDLPDHFP